jgi:hypothetical protein
MIAILLHILAGPRRDPALVPVPVKATRKK